MAMLLDGDVEPLSWAHPRSGHVTTWFVDPGPAQPDAEPTLTLPEMIEDDEDEFEENDDFFDDEEDEDFDEDFFDEEDEDDDFFDDDDDEWDEFDDEE